MLATPRHHTSLAMTCSSGAVPWAFPFFTVILSLHRDISPVTQPLLNQFPTGDVLKDFEIKILAMSFKRHWTKVPSFFIPCFNLHSRQNCQVWKSFRCVSVWLLPCHQSSTAHALPDTSFKLLVLLECLDEWEQSQEEDYPSIFTAL